MTQKEFNTLSKALDFMCKDIMKSKEWRMGGAPKFRMKDWYDGFIEKGVQMGQEKVFKDAWKVFCNELGSAKFSKPPIIKEELFSSPKTAYCSSVKKK